MHQCKIGGHKTILQTSSAKEVHDCNFIDSFYKKTQFKKIILHVIAFCFSTEKLKARHFILLEFICHHITSIVQNILLFCNYGAYSNGFQLCLCMIYNVLFTHFSRCLCCSKRVLTCLVMVTLIEQLSVSCLSHPCWA